MLIHIQARRTRHLLIILCCYQMIHVDGGTEQRGITNTKIEVCFKKRCIGSRLHSVN
jgi:hypothetical protein